LVGKLHEIPAFIFRSTPDLHASFWVRKESAALPSVENKKEKEVPSMASRKSCVAMRKEVEEVSAPYRWRNAGVQDDHEYTSDWKNKDANHEKPEGHLASKEIFS